MDGPEDKGSRYRLVMFIALAAIVGPGFFLLNWIGDNGVNNLFRQILGMDAARPRVTRTVSPEPSAIAAATPVPEPTASATASGNGVEKPTPEVMPTATAPVPAAPTTSVPTSVPTVEPSATPVPPTAIPPPPATETPRPSPAPTRTPNPDALGYGTAVPAYGGAAVIRAAPNTEAEAVGSIPLEEQVLVIRIVEGEAIDPVESRWWEVEYGDVHGFVYHKLITLN